MNPDTENSYRDTLENDPPPFFDRVNSPWDQVPDYEDYNRHAYQRIVRALKGLSRDGMNASDANSEGILVLGEAGTGKTHLLMRVARNLSNTNHILFIRKPNNEEAVAQHIWANTVNSLARTLDSSENARSQLDDLLAHVFSNVLIPEFEKDVAEGKNAKQKSKWVSRLREDPYQLFNMLGEGKQRKDNFQRIRKRTLRFLQQQHPDVDQRIAWVLITYCFVAEDDRKRLLLTWLSGQDVDESDATNLGLPATWVSVDDDSTQTSVAQQREEQALRAIRTIGILSTYYQPLILAFDQLEGLRDNERLTTQWGDVVREIFTMTPNFLVITCIFPSLWETWFRNALDQSVSERIAQQTVELETFNPQHGFQLLGSHLESSFTKHRLPTSIFPFEDHDVELLSSQATSPRSFLQAARNQFQSWLDGIVVETPVRTATRVVQQDEIDKTIQAALVQFEGNLRRTIESDFVAEHDFSGRIREVLKTVFRIQNAGVKFGKAKRKNLVMPPNLILKGPDDEAVCIAVVNSVGNKLTAQLRNLEKCFRKRKQFNELVIFRERRKKRPGTVGQKHLDAAHDLGAAVINAGGDEVIRLSTIYEALVAIEERDLSIANHEIDKHQFVAFLDSHGWLQKSELLECVARRVGFALAVTKTDSVSKQRLTETLLPELRESVPSNHGLDSTIPSATDSVPADHDVFVDGLIGDDELNSPHVAVLGELTDTGRKLGVSLTKPQCMVILGYMGSGKSYALGVLIESALLQQTGLIRQARPMTVVAFNYRRNPEARFEFGGFTQPNQVEAEVQKLAEKYMAHPQAVRGVNVFGFEGEIPRRQSEYGSLATFPIKFRPDELSADHWEILMKPPTREAEYMDIIRDIIQRLFYEERLTFENLKRELEIDERMSAAQRRKAMNRMSFAERWIDDERAFEWSDILTEGTLNIFDLRMQALESSEALKLCLIVTDLVRRTKNGVNKAVVFDEAHEYVDSKELVGELENSITQIRHDGLTFILASQFPERIPERIFKYLLTRLIFKIPNQKAISFIRRAAPNLECISPNRVANLDLEQGLCLIQTDDDCTLEMLRSPQLLEIRPRCTMHGGATIRQTADETEASAQPQPEMAVADFEFEELQPELCPECGEELILRRAKSGPVLVCCTYPVCRFGKPA